MYLQFYGLTEQPFSATPDPKFLYLTPAHREALAQLLYGVQEGKGFLVLTGEVGTGKTTLLHTLLQRLSTDTAVAFVLNSAMPFDGILEYALEFVQTDSFARFHRAHGEDVLFLTGADENSLKNVLAAEAEGITTRELVDRNVEHFLQLHEKLGVSFDRFIRTSVDEWHARGATKIWRRMAAADDLYKKNYTGLYCVACEQFYLPEELVDGRCPEHGTIPETVSEENWFFRLSRYAKPLLEEIRAGRLRIIPDSRRNEIVSFVERGLEDISVSRSQERARGWGMGGL